jgi:pimeloyl-ACP methyl ester carboxylesterase
MTVEELTCEVAPRTLSTGRIAQMMNDKKTERHGVESKPVPLTGRRIPAYVRTAVILLSGILGVSCASTPPIVDEHGERLPGSVASLEQIELRGTKQWILLRGARSSAPVLLWLHGGPGGSAIGWNRKYLQALEEDVVFVDWEQRGAGKSYHAADFDTITVQDYVDDTIALSEYLTARFNTPKIVLVGHSWGSTIGLMAADQRPDLYHCFVGIAQQVNSVENDTMGYHMVLERAREKGDRKVVDKLTKQGPPPYSKEQSGAYKTLFSRLPGCPPSICSKISMLAAFVPQEYSLLDSLRAVRGVFKGTNDVYPQLVDLDVERDIPQLEIPVLFVAGRYDYIHMQDIAFRYYQSLRAPVKRFYWFEHSGHFPCYQEPERFRQLMRSEILPLAE